MSEQTAMWVAFGTLMAVMLASDLGVFVYKKQVIFTCLAMSVLASLTIGKKNKRTAVPIGVK